MYNGDADFAGLPCRMPAASLGGLDQGAAFIVARHRRSDLDRLPSAIHHRHADDDMPGIRDDGDSWDAG
jgi:hypothetical protein